MVTIDYFSDVLCIWAYGGQVRVDELIRHFGDKIEWRYRFIPIFGCARENIEKNWSEKGGFEGFNEHLNHVAGQWDHVDCHQKLWLDCKPASSITPHVVLKAAWLMQEQELIDAQRIDSFDGRTCFEQLMWLTRQAFFEFNQDISRIDKLKPLVERAGIDWQQLNSFIENGEAYAALYADDELKREHCVKGSPSFVLNEGRQVLYGNVGYRIVEANIDELLKRENANHGASWC